MSPVPQGDAPLCSGLKVVLGKVLGGHQGGNPEPGHLTTESDGGRGAARDTLCPAVACFALSESDHHFQCQ